MLLCIILQWNHSAFSFMNSFLRISTPTNFLLHNKTWVGNKFYFLINAFLRLCKTLLFRLLRGTRMPDQKPETQKSGTISTGPKTPSSLTRSRWNVQISKYTKLEVIFFWETGYIWIKSYHVEYFSVTLSIYL